MDQMGLVRQMSATPVQDAISEWMGLLQQFAVAHSEDIYQGAMKEEAKSMLGWYDVVRLYESCMMCFWLLHMVAWICLPVMFQSLCFSKENLQGLALFSLVFLFWHWSCVVHETKCACVCLCVCVYVRLCVC